MSNKILLSCSIEELKEKITRFYFSDGGFFEGYDSIEIIKNDTQIKCIFSQSLTEEAEENILSKENWNEFINELFIENIQKWKNRYVDKYVCDGEQWELEIEFKDLPKLKCYGSNKYPINWQRFLAIIYKYFPQIKNINDYDEDEE